MWSPSELRLRGVTHCHAGSCQQSLTSALRCRRFDTDRSGLRRSTGATGRPGPGHSLGGELLRAIKLELRRGEPFIDDAPTLVEPVTGSQPRLRLVAARNSRGLVAPRQRASGRPVLSAEAFDPGVMELRRSHSVRAADVVLSPSGLLDDSHGGRAGTRLSVGREEAPPAQHAPALAGRHLQRLSETVRADRPGHIALWLVGRHGLSVRGTCCRR